MNKLNVIPEKCIACGLCYLNYPEVFDCDDEGIELNYECLSQAVSEIRRSKCLSPRWRDAIDEDIKKRKI